MTAEVFVGRDLFRIVLGDGAWVAIRWGGRWEIYDHYPDEPGLERFIGYANDETADALERVYGIHTREAEEAALHERIRSRAASVIEARHLAVRRNDVHMVSTIDAGCISVDPPERATLVLGDGNTVEATRVDVSADWIADVACPVCTARPVKVRGYADELKSNERRSWAPAWCSGRHDAPIGTLEVVKAPVDHHTLRFMGIEGQEETFRCRIY